MKQRTLAMMTGFEQYKKKTLRAIFLEEMEQVVPWRELCALVEPHYPKAGNGRRPPVGVERMLRIYPASLPLPALRDDSAMIASITTRPGSTTNLPSVLEQTTICTEYCCQIQRAPDGRENREKHLLDRHNGGLGARKCTQARQLALHL